MGGVRPVRDAHGACAGCPRAVHPAVVVIDRTGMRECAPTCRMWRALRDSEGLRRYAHRLVRHVGVHASRHVARLVEARIQAVEQGLDQTSLKVGNHESQVIAPR